MGVPSAGEFTKLIEIQQNNPSKGAQGGIADNWTVLTNMWAKVNNLSGSNKRSTDEGGGKVTEARTEFTMYFIDGINSTMRIKFKNKYFDIAHVNNYLEENRYLIITATEGVNLG